VAVKTSAKYAKEVYKGHEGCVMIAGSTSEFYAMTDDESAVMIKAVVDVLSGHVPVIAGTERAATGLSVEMTRLAADLGIDMALISTPYYMYISEDGIEYGISSLFSPSFFTPSGVCRKKRRLMRSG
jgi:dihydrodipicolinate synthase/N-acetylneuraminate lyase